MRFYKKKKFWAWFWGVFFGVPVILFAISVLIIYTQQDRIVRELLTTINEDFKGRIAIDDSHISPFSNFPYISIDLDQLRIYENKDESSKPIVQVEDAYIGFDLMTMISGKFDIKSVKLTNGFVNLVQHHDGSLNIVSAFSGKSAVTDSSKSNEDFHLDLKSIKLEKIDLTKLNESNNLLVEAFIHEASSRFRTVDDHYSIGLDAKFLLNVVSDGDTTYIKHKHFKIDAGVDFNNSSQIITIKKSKVQLEHANFNVEGNIDLDDDANLDIQVHGSKPNFDLLIAFAPEELIPVLESYDNSGRVYFEAIIKGKSTNGHNPFIAADFGCEQAYFNNEEKKKKLDDINFIGHFTNGAARNATTTEFSLINFSAKPGAGIFSGNLKVKNFLEPEVDMQVSADFELEFLAQFLNLNDFENLKGSVVLTMNFKDVININNIDESMEKFNESYKSELKITNLSFNSRKFSLPFENINMTLSVDGHEAAIRSFTGKVGGSDVTVGGSISDLPAIIHKSSVPVTSTLQINSNYINLHELLVGFGMKDVTTTEQVRDFKMKLHFICQANELTSAKGLPKGEFFIDNLGGKIKNYPHHLHDIHADIFIEEEDLRIVDFSGVIDKSDIHFSGKLKHYDYWLKPNPKGDINLEFDLTSNLLQLEDLFTYDGENFVPEEYRHEEFREVKIHGRTVLHYNGKIKSADVYLTRLDALMKIHPLKFEQFNGRVHYEDDHIRLEKLSGKIGKSIFTIDLDYYLGKAKSTKRKSNHLGIQARHLDMDELIAYTPEKKPISEIKPEDHEKVFNIYDLPFSEMTFDLDILHLNYHKILIDNIKGKLRTTENHYIYLDNLNLDAAGGHFNINGYFNGSDRNKIYFSPDIKVKNADLDKLFFKFENFGQDHLVSENIHGKLSGHLTGKVHMHADMVPIINDSEIHFDMDIMEGKLENYPPLTALSDFFKDKNLSMVMFDTLSNHIDITNGVLTIPRMTINTTLGFMEFSGKQELDGDMEYYVRVPLKLVTEVGFTKLFNKKRDEVDPEQVDAIQYRDKSKKIPFINIKITGNADKYKISLGKDKNVYQNQQ